MGEDGSNISIPGWIGKAILGVLQAIILTALFATITWAWNTESRVSDLESSLSQTQASVAVQEAKLSVVDQHETELEVLKTELKYIREDLADIKTLLTNR